ncbi:Ribokinase-like protein [Amylocarpus encephaloides]|uniref:ATP-dependent (S)-NAD(P)H-hydrate dehydratase n=1 Tax=Amylocarpus encephaloides TaxID=45428 RepID=A0A9P7YS75_9HELO|nr:Ribokinase-like protein [Amylocarpus encephaloides]
MSPKTRDILLKVRKMVPPMLEKFHKGTLLLLLPNPQTNLPYIGQMGRIAVIGGSEDYTGAPYFSAMASAKLGADMSHIICEPLAAQVIKTYSPNLMVHPLMRQSSHANTTETASTIARTIIAMLPRLHVLVIGPGLGRDELMQDTCAKVLEAAREKNMPFVLDADGLNLAQTRPELVHGYRECILTPNIVEFARLCKSKGIDPGDGKAGVETLSRAFGGVTIVQKGKSDLISNGERTYVSDLAGGLKRSGGQGDTLTGSLATFLGWRKAYLDGLWEHEGDLDGVELLALAAFGGSAVTRECSRLAFEKKGRSLQASDLTEEVYVAFMNLLDEPASKL